MLNIIYIYIIYIYRDMFFGWFIYSTWWFSIAMLNNQRVNERITPLAGLTPELLTMCYVGSPWSSKKFLFLSSISGKVEHLDARLCWNCNWWVGLCSSIEFMSVDWGTSQTNSWNFRNQRTNHPRLSPPLIFRQSKSLMRSRPDLPLNKLGMCPRLPVF